MERLVKSIINQIVQAIYNGELIEYISEIEIEIKKSSNGDIEQIVFKLSDSYLYLDFVDYLGVIYRFMDEGEIFSIPFLVREDMRIKIEELLMEVA